MKAILVPYSHPCDWCDVFFPKRSLCSLTIAGKPLAEYQVDVASQLNATSAAVLDYNYIDNFQKYLCAGQRWPMDVTYEGTSLFSTFDSLLNRRAGYIGNESVLVFWGAVLPNVQSIDEILTRMETVEKTPSMPDGLYLWENGTLKRCNAPYHTIDSLKAFFELNFALLESPGIYVLPGYSAENKVYTGMNVAILPKTDIRPPVMLCDDLCVERECVLMNGVILGHKALVDHGTLLSHSIVMDHTFVGHRMEIDNKIVDSARIIDPYAAIFIDQEDMGIAADMRKFDIMPILYRSLEYVIALLLVLIYLVPYLLYLPWKFLLDNTIWSYKLSTDRYPKCLLVLCGKASLIKDSPEDKVFAFRSSDGVSFRHPEALKEIDDQYYFHHRSAYSIITIVVKGLISRLFANEQDRKNE